MKKRKIYKVLITVILLGFLWNFRPERTRIDGLSGEIWNLMLATDTKYADGYTNKAFLSVEHGMSEKEVLEILGEPLMRFTPYQHSKFRDRAHFVALQYSESPSSTHYRLRQVYLNNGVVAEVIGYFYVD